MLYLIELGLSDKRIALVTGISRATIRDWKQGRIPGAGHGSQPRARDCPVCGSGRLDPATYAYLLGMYLGDGWISRMPRGVFKLRICLDLKYPNIIEECAAAMAAVRPATAMKVGRVARIGCVELTAHWKHWRACSRNTGRA